MRKNYLKIISCACFWGLLFTLVLIPGSTVQAVSPNIVISQVYGGGGNSGATYTNDFIELFNLGASTVNITGWSVQYAAAAGTTWQVTSLSGSIAPGQYYLVQEAPGAGGTTPLPTPDATGTIALSATNGKIALVNSTTALSGSCPSSTVDFVGYGSLATCFEGSGAAPTLSNTTAALRANDGCTDTDDNAADFTADVPAPRNTASPLNGCGGPTIPTGVGAASPSAVFAGDSTLLTVTVTPGTNPVSTGLAVASDLSSIGGSATQSFYDDGTNGDVTAGDNVYSFFTSVAAATTPGVKTIPATITDAEARTGTTSISLTINPPLVAIHDIQGASHISPINGQLVSTQGIVTAKRTNGFYMQDPNPDSDEATSEAIFVFTSSAPAVAIGDLVLVTGTVQEFRSGGASSTNLTTTEIGNPGQSVTIMSSSNPLPAPVIIGSGGRIPPAMIIEDDASGDVETSGVFDPANDGLDFYESLEGMLVQVNDAVAVGPTNDFVNNREIAVVGDNGANASVRTLRGGIVIRANDFNPERIILNDSIAGGPILPSVNVGDSFPGTIVGVMDYSFGNFKLQVISLPPLSDNGLQKEITTPAGTNQLAVATFNVANLAPTDPPSKFAGMANLIVNNLKSPDVLGIEVLQDDTGAIDNGVVDATLTWNILIAAIQAAGGPPYNYRQIDPVNDQDGGLPGGNIRQGFLFRTDRGLSFVDHPGGNATSANLVVNGPTGPDLLFSPGRIDPINPAFNFSRKPLAGEFMYHGDKVFIIANHFNTKGGDDPLFGHFQPPILFSEVQRIMQAQIVNNFVNSILALDPDANVIVLGDLNDYEFSPPLAVLKGAILNNLIETLPQEERYTYVFEGNSEALDHILVSNRLFNTPLAFNVVHVNAEFVVQASDHDPVVAQLCAERMPPQVQIVVPQANAALQDGVTFAATASDAGGIDKVFFYVREPDGGTGTPIGYEDLAASYNSGTGYWEYEFDTTKLQDGYYVILAKAVDKCGNEALSQVTAFSIRNWAVIELLPATPNNKAGRTMPIRFSLRIAASVDPAMPFVYNEDLEIRIYDAKAPGTILQRSVFGDGSTDYRINGEMYITNFKTDKKPATYVVEIWRPAKNFMIGSFTFMTVK